MVVTDFQKQFVPARLAIKRDAIFVRLHTAADILGQELLAVEPGRQSIVAAQAQGQFDGFLDIKGVIQVGASKVVVFESA